MSYVVVTGLSLPGAAVLTLAGGVMFGLVTGTDPGLDCLCRRRQSGLSAARSLFRDEEIKRFGPGLEVVQEGIRKEGCEISQALAELGARVTLMQHSGRFLRREDGDVAAGVHQYIEADGVHLITDCQILAFASCPEEQSCSRRDPQPGTLPLPICNVSGGSSRHSRTTFTDPEVASVGLNEQAADRQGDRILGVTIVDEHAGALLAAGTIPREYEVMLRVWPSAQCQLSWQRGHVEFVRSALMLGRGCAEPIRCPPLEWDPPGIPDAA